MTTTSFGTNHEQTVKLWSKTLSHEAFSQTYVSRFMGEGSKALFSVVPDLARNAGDRVRISLRHLLKGDGVAGADTLEGNEEALSFAKDDILIDELAWAVRWKTKIDQQRVAHDLRTEAVEGLGDWFADRFDQAAANQLSGNTDEADLKYTGQNATIAPTSGTGNTRIIAALADSEASMSSTANQGFTLNLIDLAVKQAKTADPLIRPIKVNGMDKYVVFLTPSQVFQLRTTVSTTAPNWYNQNTARIQGGEMDNAIFNGALGEYNNVIIHEWARLGVSPGNVLAHRAVFCGAQALGVSYSRETPSMGRLDWNEESFDHGRQHAVKSGSIFGFKKTQFANKLGTTVDYGTIVLSSVFTA